jgi:hypothetical protein
MAVSLDLNLYTIVDECNILLSCAATYWLFGVVNGCQATRSSRRTLVIRFKSKEGRDLGRLAKWSLELKPSVI